MLTIFISIAIAVIVWLVWRRLTECILLICLGFVVSLTFPYVQYDEPVEKTINLIGLSRYGDNTCYLRVSNDNEYTYMTMEKNKQGIVVEHTETVKSVTIEEYNKYSYVSEDKYLVTVVEDENCTKPILKKYVQKPKNIFLSFTLQSFYTKSEYIFIVPKGSVTKQL